MISAGVCISCKSGRQNTTVSTASATANATASHTMFPINRRRSSKSFEPNRCAMGMAKPLHTPSQKPMIKKLMEPVEPTAASGPVPRNCPTMIVSTIE